MFALLYRAVYSTSAPDELADRARMGDRRPLAESQRGGGAADPAAGLCRRLAARSPLFSRAHPARRGGTLAAGPAAGGDRLGAAAAVRPHRAGRAVARAPDR